MGCFRSAVVTAIIVTIPAFSLVRVGLQQAGHAAEGLLAQPYSRGVIDEAEYEQKLSVLASTDEPEGFRPRRGQVPPNA